MKKNCMKVQEKIGSGDILSSGEKRHLESCADCALFRGIALCRDGENTDTAFEVPARLDTAILYYAHSHRPERRAEKPLLRLWKIMLPAVAVFALCAGVLFYAMPGGKMAGYVSNRIPAKAPVLKTASEVWSAEVDEKMFTLGCEVGNGVASISGTLDMI